MHLMATTRRLFLAFGALFVLFGGISLAAIAGFNALHDDARRLKERGEGVRAALELASAVRDQYAHQAHVIIFDNDTHIGFYEEARRHVLSLIKAVRAQTRSAEESAWVDEIERASADLDGVFRTGILPAVRRGDRVAVELEHTRALGIVWQTQALTDRLVHHIGASIGDLEERAAAIQRRAMRWTVALILFATLFSVAVSVYITRSVARPLRLLERGAERLTAGDLDTRIELDRSDEFGRLAHQFNAMTAALKGHQRQLVESEKLAGIGRLAAGLAHEINNPLGVILGYVRMLRKNTDGPLDDDLRIIEEEGVRCQEIVQGLLDLSRPARNPAQDIDLRQTCDDVVARLRESAFGAIDVEVHGAAQGIGNPQTFRQAVLNVVKNAAEAAGSGGHVRIDIARANGHASIAVEDNGPGLSDAQRAHLFEPFFTTKADGTGLGLAVSRAAMRAQGGDVRAESSAGGARFTLSLPAAEGR
jgi:signal transduction histidine kinase